MLLWTGYAILHKAPLALSASVLLLNETYYPGELEAEGDVLESAHFTLFLTRMK